MFIDESRVQPILQSLNEQELVDVIRIAQRILKAKVEQTRLAGSTIGAKQTWRFWDRPLQLDWQAAGLPKIHFPSGHHSGEPAVCWGIFNLLRGSARESKPIDWEVFELLSPKQKMMEVGEVNWDVFQLLAPSCANLEPEEEPACIAFVAVDWSGDRLPHLKLGPSLPVRRPGRPGRVRTGRHHRAIEPRRTCLSASTEAEAVAKTLATPTHRFAMPAKKDTFLTKPHAGRRPVVRIQQPNGGGR